MNQSGRTAVSPRALEQELTTGAPLPLIGGMLGWSELVATAVVQGSEALGEDAVLVQLRRRGKGCLGYAVVARDRVALRAANRGVPVHDPWELEFGPNRCAVTGGNL